MSNRACHLPITLAEAPGDLREAIYRARHAVYALEIGQHPANDVGRLTDALDTSNRYIAATCGGMLAGFVSITPPGPHGYSIDKYFRREELPFTPDGGTYEIRLLTVLPDYRASDAAVALMIAAFRWIESRGGTRIVAIGRREVVDMYRRVGLAEAGMSVRSGAVTYDLMQAPVSVVRDGLDRREDLLRRVERSIRWELQVPLRKPAACFHGGAFFDAVGSGFDSLDKSRTVINADVLDAWFPPAPGVLESLSSHLPWLLRTSPPTGCEGLIAAISAAGGVPESCILPGAGSSDLIFRAFPRWLNRDSHAVLLDPTYGEYAHVLEKVIGCHVERLPLRRSDGYAVNLDRLRELISRGPDLVVIVNPNSPTGRGLTCGEIESLLKSATARTRVWIDETYIDYTGESVEPLVSRYDSLIVCKSMSKVYALSGARVAYLCAGPHHLEELRAFTPPWVVSLPAQVAAVRALQDPGYYASRIAETHALRKQLEKALRGFGWDVVPGCANFVLAHLPEDGPTAAEIVKQARVQNLFLRDAGKMGSALGEFAIRVAVKDAPTQRRMISILEAVASAVPCPA
ncbi:histidinol-phosphate transaminase [Haloferula sp. BvORR071]|uniref:pyridoxal phosphate-dependent aminotransferase n=1 Tax=Haloferula sp. BvORR071 TaxID=1396141 RepID=UPI0006980437|nr:histidinol-phosphate transaminase [Haloferula sp. BvORR071]